MRIVFWGNDYYSSIALTQLISRGMKDDICLVVTTKKKGSMPFSYRSVFEQAESHSIPSLYCEDYPTLYDMKNEIAAIKPNIGLVHSFGYLIPKEIYTIPKRDTLNIHPSLLPNYRGATPIQQAILDGATQTGVTLMMIDDTFDTGDIVDQATVDINDRDTTLTLANSLIPMGVDLFIGLIEHYPEGTFPIRTQASSDATQTRSFSKKDTLLTFSESAEIIDRTVRAFYPKPIAWTDLATLVTYLNPHKEIPEKWNSKTVQIYEGMIESNRYLPTSLQIEGKARIDGDEFIRGYVQ